MSRFQFRRPVFRLVFGRDDARLHGPRGGPPLHSVRLDAPDLDAQLREVGRVVGSAGGRVTVEIPASEVWSAHVAGPGRIGRWFAARRAASRALGLPARRIAVSAANPAAAAAVTRATLAQTRRYLGSVGIPVARFAAPTAAGARVPVGLAAPTPAAGSAGLAVAALCLSIWAWPHPAVVPVATSEVAAAPDVAVPPEPAVPEPATARAHRPPTVQEIAGDPPRKRPPRAAAAPVVPETPPAAPDPVPSVTKAARDLPGLEASRRTLTEQPPPLPRATVSGAVPETPTPAAEVVADPAPAAAGMKPMRRPATRNASPDVTDATPATVPGSTENGSTTLSPRPRVPAATPNQAVSVAVVAAAPVLSESVRPEPRQTAARQVVFKAQQPTIRHTAAPRPVAARTVTAPKPAAAPQRQVTARRAVVPQPAAARQPAAAPARSTVRTRTGLQSNRMSLVGVFGATNNRRALVRMPSGRVHRVRAGDQVEGVRVASVSSDSVHMTGRGTNVVLALP